MAKRTLPKQKKVNPRELGLLFWTIKMISRNLACPLASLCLFPSVFRDIYFRTGFEAVGQLRGRTSWNKKTLDEVSFSTFFAHIGQFVQQ